MPRRRAIRQGDDTLQDDGPLPKRPRPEKHVRIVEPAADDAAADDAAGVDAAADDDGVPFTTEEAYRMQSACIKANGYAKHHIDSYEDFMFNKIAACISEYPPVVVRHNDEEHALQIIDYRFGDPSVRESNGRLEPITPAECHLRRITYEVPLIVHAQYTRRHVETNQVTHSYIIRDRELDRLPCMKMSSLCSLRRGRGVSKEDLNEPGGTFLPTGTEKVVVGQEHVRNNFPFVLAATDGSYTCEYRSYNEQKIRSTSTLHINLTPPFKCETMAQRMTVVPRILVRVPYVNVDIPVVSMFILLMRDNNLDRVFAYLVEDDDKDWFKMRVWEIITQDVDASVMSYEKVVNRLVSERQGYPGESVERNIHKVVGNINSEFLPNQGYALEDLPGKTVCFASYVRKLIRVYYGLQLADDRDDYMHRRCILNGTMLALLFRKQYTMWRRRLAVKMRHDLNNGAQTVNIADHLKSNIGAHLHYALSTGNFSMQRQNNNLTGVAQALTRTEPYTALSHMRRNNNPVNKEGKNTKPRLLHPSSFGLICPWDTPEGQPCGLMRNMAILSGIRVGYDTNVLLMVVMMTGMVDSAGRNEPHARRARVWVNGYLAGHCAAPTERVVTCLKNLRTSGDLPNDVSIYVARDRWSSSSQGELHVSGDAGSYYWPLIRVDKLDVLRRVLDSRSVTDDTMWRELLSLGVIELMSKDEESVSARVAFEPKELVPGHRYTHVMIHPTQICSIATNRGPLIEFNQSPRVTYQAAMGKQAIGPPMTNARYRADTMMHSLHYPQKPLVETWMDRQLNNSCSCNNGIVAIMAESFNMEDSIIMNRASVDRGMFRSSLTRTTRTVVRGSENEHLEYPPENTKSMLFSSYDMVDRGDGVVNPGDRLQADDVIISKTAHTNLKKKKDAVVSETAPETLEKIRDRSVSLKGSEEVTVEEVLYSSTPAEGDTTVRIKTRAQRIPQRGDKFASRYGQKGVVGEMRNPEDMPYTTGGIIPDLIINPHCVPSRMTIGHMLDALLSKLATALGHTMDGTPFTWSSRFAGDPNSAAFVDWIGDQLEAQGYQRHGEEEMFDGTTGRRIKSMIFLAPIAYLKLRHMAEDKEHTRSEGPVNNLTRQPLEGRNRDGGLRYGEMERDAGIAHGGADVTRDRLMISSDQAEVPVCSKCGRIAQVPKKAVDTSHIMSATVHGDKPFCRNCLSYDTVGIVRMPYAMKVTLQEMEGVAMVARMKFKE